MDAILSYRGLTFGYPSHAPVFEGLEWEVPAGERTCLTGHNGCGKSTLLQLTLGLLKAQSGSVEFLGRPCAWEPDFVAARREVGLLFQDSDDQLFCPTVYEDVAFGPLNLGWSRGEVDAVVEETLASLNLSAYRDRVTYRLSHGEKRLVALAAILAMKPKVLLLDEPTTGLDHRHEELLATILIGLPQDMLIVSHNRDFMDRVATRYAILEEGRIENTPAAYGAPR